MTDQKLKLIDRYVVYMLINKNMFLGDLMITNQGIAFKSQADLKSDSIKIAGGILFGTGPYQIYAKNNDFDLLIPNDQIANVEIQKKMIVMKNLVVTTKNKEEIIFRFGMLSPQKALDQITECRTSNP